MSKDIILNYCKAVKTHDINHLQNALDNERCITYEEYDKMSGCPSNFGLDSYIGLCEIEVVDSLGKQEQQCLKCWKQALGVEETENGNKKR